jgi:hypothetical protein
MVTWIYTVIVSALCAAGQFPVHPNSRADNLAATTNSHATTCGLSRGIDQFSSQVLTRPELPPPEERTSPEQKGRKIPPPSEEPVQSFRCHWQPRQATQNMGEKSRDSERINCTLSIDHTYAYLYITRSAARNWAERVLRETALRADTHALDRVKARLLR